MCTGDRWIACWYRTWIACVDLETDKFYGVATISKLLKVIGLFWRISSLLYGSFAKETYDFKEPTSRSHPIVIYADIARWWSIPCVWRMDSILMSHRYFFFSLISCVQETHPPSRSNCTLFCLGVRFIPRDLLHISNSRKIFNVRMKVIFGGKSLSSLYRILRQGLTTVFYHSKRCGKLITCGARASWWVWKMYSDFRCIFCWSLLGTAGPLRRRK